MKSPMQKVKEAFGSKDKLVEELLGMVKKPADLSRDDLKKKLRSQSNLKLLAMVSREKKIRDQFGGREQLIEAIVKTQMGTKQKENKDYQKHITVLSSGQLMDLAHRCGVAIKA